MENEINVLKALIVAAFLTFSIPAGSSASYQTLLPKMCNFTISLMQQFLRYLCNHLFICNPKYVQFMSPESINIVYGRS